MSKLLKKLFIEINKKFRKNIKLENLKDLLDKYDKDDWKDYVEFKNNNYSKTFMSNELFEIIIISWNHNQKSNT